MDRDRQKSGNRTGFWLLLAAGCFLCVLLIPEGAVPGEAFAALAIAGVLFTGIGAVTGVRGAAQKKKGGGGMKGEKGKRGALVAILVALNLIVGIVYLLPEFVQDTLAFFIALISVIIICAGLFLWLRAVLSKKQQPAERSARRWARTAAGRTYRMGGDRPLPTATARSFSPAVYDENLREDAASRDRQRRLEQLKGFYKNGLLEKEEYLKLRKHYENS